MPRSIRRRRRGSSSRSSRRGRRTAARSRSRASGAGTFDLYAMSADGSGTRRLTSTKEDDVQPDWSPDGKRIVFARGSPAPPLRHGRRRRRRAPRHGARKSTRASPRGRRTAAGSPTSRRSPARASASSGSCGPDGSQRRRLTKLGGVAQAPSWSPDGRGSPSPRTSRRWLRHLHGRGRREGRAPRDVG